MNIIDAIEDPNLFRPFLGDDLVSWQPWITALRAMYGLSISGSAPRRLVQQCTGRAPGLLPTRGFDSALFLTGRRSGKSRIAAVMGAFEAALAGHEAKLAPGEHGVVPILSPTRQQSRVVRDYIRALFETPLLAAEVARETRDGFELKNGTRVEIQVGDFRTIRAYTLLAAIVDEACFFGVGEESRVKSDTELIRALRPGLATVHGKLVCISSPYARRGWCYGQYERHYGNDASGVLVWNCPSRTMNPTLPQRVVDAALAEDLQAAKSEYLGEFRDDISAFIPREVIEALVVPGRTELLPQRRINYLAFADVSGGRGDDAALAIAHEVGRTVVVDFVKRYAPPFDPNAVIADMAREARRFDVRTLTGDAYGADFVSVAFQAQGLHYEKADKNKSDLYTELLPRLCSKEIELPDYPMLVDQLAALERRTRASGRDLIEHPPGGHDDLANVVAGVAVAVQEPVLEIGLF